MTDIVLVNRYTAAFDAELRSALPAFQAQVTEDWLPHWPGRGATLHFAGFGEAVPAGMQPLYHYATTDIPGAGGYHDADGGLPQGKVFVADALSYGIAWPVDTSHEILEMLGDPYVNTIRAIRGTRLHCYQEVCDAVEADRYGYSKPRWPHVRLTDFCYPAYFTGERGGKFDAMGHLTGPAPTLLHGGYLGIQLPNGQWTQIVMRREDGSMSRRAQRDGRTANRLGQEKR